MADASWDVLQTEKDSVIWVATESGALQINNQQPLMSKAPPVFITDVSCNSISVQKDSPGNFTLLNPRQDNVHFEFSSTLLRYEKNIFIQLSP
jgi:hypothetical protein